MKKKLACIYMHKGSCNQMKPTLEARKFALPEVLEIVPSRIMGGF